ncbi:MAG: hypothetical protein ACYCXG_04795 [Acidiferrobacter sp.]
MKKLVLMSACTLALLSGCAYTPQKPAAHLPHLAATRVQQAERAVKLTRAMGALWLPTPHALAVAIQADKSHHYTHAIRAANMVLAQCHLAQHQHAANADAGPFYP